MAEEPKQEDRDAVEGPASGGEGLDYDHLEKILTPDKTPRAGRSGRGTSVPQRGQKARGDADYEMLAEVLDKDRSEQVTVSISADRLEATIVELHPGVTHIDVMKALRKQGIACVWSRACVDAKKIGVRTPYGGFLGQSVRNAPKQNRLAPGDSLLQLLSSKAVTSFTYDWLSHKATRS